MYPYHLGQDLVGLVQELKGGTYVLPSSLKFGKGVFNLRNMLMITRIYYTDFYLFIFSVVSNIMCVCIVFCVVNYSCVRTLRVYLHTRLSGSLGVFLFVDVYMSGPLKIRDGRCMSGEAGP